MARKAYPCDVSDYKWAFVAPSSDDRRCPQRVYDLREVFNCLRYFARPRALWTMMPNDLPPWHVVYQQTQRWLALGISEAMVHDLREVQLMAQVRNAEPSAAIFDSRTMQFSPESGARGGCDGAKHRKGNKVH